MVLGRKKEGKPLAETADMKMWREEFNQMSLEEHDRVLKNLGLDKEDIEEFNEAEKGSKKLEDLLGIPNGQEAPEENLKKVKGKK
ncbi:MAG TPA: hypothetical protein VJG83_06780 [archaeon]|nr:hypothetical protein [archaeon]